MICPLAWAALLFKWVPQKIHNGRSNNLYKALVTLSGKHPDTAFVGSQIFLFLRLDQRWEHRKSVEKKKGTLQGHIEGKENSQCGA